MSDTHANHPDPLIAQIADLVADRLNIDALAARIADHLRTAPGSAAAPHPGELIEEKEIRRQLGRRGRPMASQTFRINYLETKKLTRIPGPSGSKRYILRAEWERVKNEIKTV